MLTRGLNWGPVPLLAPGTNICLTTPGQVIDSPNDTAKPSQLDIAPDLVTGSVSVAGDSLRLRARFYPGTFDPATTIVTFALDTDQNAGTGQAGATLDTDRSIGADYVVSMGSTLYGQKAQIMKYAGANAPTTFALAGFSPVTIYPDGIDTLIPLSLLNSNGQLNFRVTSSAVLPSGSIAPAIDYMPDLGLPPGSTNCSPSSTANFTPSVYSGGVVNGSSFGETAVSPGEIITLFGAAIGPKTLAGLTLTNDGMVSTQLGGVRVLFDGVPAPLIYVQEGQVSVVAPYSIAGKKMTQVQIENNGQRSNPVTLTVGKSAPGLFTLDSSGLGQGAILNQDSSVNSASNPADRNSIVVLYGTGEGITIPAGIDGKPAATPLPAPMLPVSVMIGGQPAKVLYAGSAPGFVAGVLQVNVQIPDGITGPNVPVQLQVGDNMSSTGVTLTVK